MANKYYYNWLKNSKNKKAMLYLNLIKNKNMLKDLCSYRRKLMELWDNHSYTQGKILMEVLELWTIMLWSIRNKIKLFIWKGKLLIWRLSWEWKILEKRNLKINCKEGSLQSDPKMMKYKNWEMLQEVMLISRKTKIKLQMILEGL